MTRNIGLLITRFFLSAGRCLVISLFIFGCTDSVREKNQTITRVESKSLKYAKRFSMAKLNGFTVLYLFGSHNLNDTSAVFVLYPKQELKPNLIARAFYIATPVERIACLSSVYAGMLQKLNLLETIVAIDNADYYNNPFIIRKVTNDKIKELAKGPEIQVEQTLLLNPDLILTFGMGNPKKDVNEKIINGNIPVAISLDHLEETPLARAEWIKFIAAFFNKDVMADSLFTITEQNYNTLKKRIDTVRQKPSVFAEMKYTDAWYVPGGNSYIANLLADAGADYIWKSESRSGSIPLSFENVFRQAENADMWVNLFNNVHSKKDLLGFDERYKLFKAFKKDKIYNHNKVCNAKGYSIYWEEGIGNPDEVLKDLVYIFHPDVLTEHTLKYYKKVE